MNHTYRHLRHNISSSFYTSTFFLGFLFLDLPLLSSWPLHHHPQQCGKRSMVVTIRHNKKSMVIAEGFLLIVSTTIDDDGRAYGDTIGSSSPRSHHLNSLSQIPTPQPSSPIAQPNATDTFLFFITRSSRQNGVVM